MRRLKREDGIGLVELLIAMTILAVGILALVGGLASGYVSLRRASTQSTASALADQSMERFRALRYADIALNTVLMTTALADSRYSSDPARPSSSVTLLTCSATAAECMPIRSNVTGADGRSYRVDTFIGTFSVTNGRDVKQVTVVVRSSDAATEYAREQSTFDRCTGEAPTDTSCAT